MGNLIKFKIKAPSTPSYGTTMQVAGIYDGSTTAGQKFCSFGNEYTHGGFVILNAAPATAGVNNIVPDQTPREGLFLGMYIDGHIVEPTAERFARLKNNTYNNTGLADWGVRYVRYGTRKIHAVEWANGYKISIDVQDCRQGI